MSPSTFQSVKDANGNYIFGWSPPSNDFDQSFKSFNDGVNSTMKWATLASLGKLLEMFESLLRTSLVGFCFLFLTDKSVTSFNF